MLVQDIGNVSFRTSEPPSWSSWVMTMARAIILSVTVEGASQSEVAARFGVSKSWVSKLMARYRAEGDAAFEPKSRRPNTSPTRVSDVVNNQLRREWSMAPPWRPPRMS